MNIPEQTIGFSKKFLSDMLYLTGDSEIAHYHSLLMYGIDELRKTHTQEDIDAMPLSVIDTLPLSVFFERNNHHE